MTVASTVPLKRIILHASLLAVLSQCFIVFLAFRVHTATIANGAYVIRSMSVDLQPSRHLANDSLHYVAIKLQNNFSIFHNNYRMYA